MIVIRSSDDRDDGMFLIHPDDGILVCSDSLTLIAAGLIPWYYNTISVFKIQRMKDIYNVDIYIFMYDRYNLLMIIIFLLKIFSFIRYM